MGRHPLHFTGSPLDRQFVPCSHDAHRTDREHLVDIPPLLILVRQGFISRNEQIAGRLRNELSPFGRCHFVVNQPLVLTIVRPTISFAIEVCLYHLVVTVSAVRQSNQQTYGDALLDVEYVLVLAAFGRSLLLLGIAVKVEQMHLAEGSRETLPHSAKRGIVQPAVVGDES